MAATPLVYGRFKAPDAPAGTLDVYEAGSLQNRKTTYSDPDLTTPNANPVVLDSLGEADVFYSGVARLVLKKSDGSQVWDKDDIGLSGDTSSEWINSLTATYSSSTQFTLSGDQTTEYHVNRRIKLTGSSTAYGRITASSYSNPNTTVTVVLTSGTLDATLASAATSVISGNSASGIHFSHIQGSDVASVAGTTVLDTVIGDYCVITGTEAITAFTLTKGRHMFVRAGGAFSMTNGASLVLPGAANITAASGDTFLLVGEASGVVRCLYYWPTSVSITEARRLDDTAAAVSGFTSFMRRHLNNDGASSTGFDVNANVTESTFESVGPTGSSATNIWTAMDDMPSDAKTAIIVLVLEGQGAGTVLIEVWARQTGSSAAAGIPTLIAGVRGSADIGLEIMAEVPLDSSRRFDITWSATGDGTSRNVEIRLKGFGVA